MKKLSEMNTLDEREVCIHCSGKPRHELKRACAHCMGIGHVLFGAYPLPFEKLIWPKNAIVN